MDHDDLPMTCQMKTQLKAVCLIQLYLGTIVSFIIAVFQL